MTLTEDTVRERHDSQERSASFHHGDKTINRIDGSDEKPSRGSRSSRRYIFIRIQTVWISADRMTLEEDMVGERQSIQKPPVRFPHNNRARHGVSEADES